MKKTISVVLAFYLLFAALMPANAADGVNRVYADPVKTGPDKTVEIPVMIDGNTGFMGFSIGVSYDSEYFEPVSISKGEMLSGMIDDSIGTGDGSKFIVLFSGTDLIKDNGELFTVTFKTKEKTGQTGLVLSYSSMDTFDDKLNDVEFDCENITIIIGEDTTPDKPATPDTPEKPATPDSPDKPATPDVPDKPATPDTPEKPATPDSPDKPATPDTPDNPGEDELPLSVRIKNWAASLASPFNTIMSILVAPIVFIISIFE